jgi:hypothetical protein
VVADPLRMTPRKMRSATDRAEIPGFSSRWIPARAALVYGIDTDAIYSTGDYSKGGTWMSGRMIAIVWTNKNRLKGLESMKE